jgi:cell division septation protein DedD
MDFKFSKDSGETKAGEAPVEKKNQNALLILLLILVGGFAYIYLFTGLIKPQETPKPAAVQAPAAQAVKQPLPPREGETAKPDGKAAQKAEAPKSAAAPAAVPVPPAKPAAAPPPPVKPAATPAPAAKPAVAPAPPAKPVVAAAVSKPPAPVAEKKVEKVPPKAEEKKTAAAPAKPAKADTKSAPVKEGVKKPVTDSTTKGEPAAKVKKTPAESWSLTVGNYVLEEAMSADMGLIRKAGFQPVVKPSVRKKTSMNRLFVSQFDDRASAQTALEKLRRHTSDAFVMEQGGAFALYAGSYLQTDAASSEQARLKGAGYSITVKHAEIAIPSQSLAVGPFKSKKAADAAFAKLKQAGIKAALTQK